MVTLKTNYQVSTIHFNNRILGEQRTDDADVLLEKLEQNVVGDISSCYKEQLGRLLPSKIGVQEIGVLCYHNPLLVLAYLEQLGISAEVFVWKVKSVNNIVTCSN